MRNVYSLLFKTFCTCSNYKLGNSYHVEYCHKSIKPYQSTVTLAVTKWWNAHPPIWEQTHQSYGRTAIFHICRPWLYSECIEYVKELDGNRFNKTQRVCHMKTWLFRPALQVSVFFVCVLLRGLLKYETANALAGVS